MKGIPMPHCSDAELEALYRAEMNAKRRDYRKRHVAIRQFRERVGLAVTHLPGMPERAEELLREAIKQFDADMS